MILEDVCFFGCCFLIFTIPAAAVSPEESCGCASTEVNGGLVAHLCTGEAREITVGQNTHFEVSIRSEDPLSVYTLKLEVEQDWVASGPSEVKIKVDNCTVVELHGDAPGQTVAKFSCLNSSSNVTCPFTKENLHLAQTLVSVVRSLPLNIVILVVGWIYATAGVLSFYPQIFYNFKRRSVEGLSFDFLGLNFTGGLAYAMFNIGLYTIPQVKEEYFGRHPGGVNPVLLNDVVFSVCAAFSQGILILQCFIHKHGKQKLSYSGVVLMSILWLIMLVALFVSVAEVVDWLDYLYIISYIKLAVTPIKYIPQIWTNFCIKSTVGFSIGYIILELVGGSFSVLQMFLLSYNYDDWTSIFGDPTKFGFGALTVFFDLILLFQHFFYKRKEKVLNHNSTVEDGVEDKMTDRTEQKEDIKLDKKMLELTEV